jgi:Tfp pilus assembly protein PilN
MQLAYPILVLLHLIGFAALLGGVLVQLRSKEPEVNAAMLHGSLTLLITGLALVILEEIRPDPVNYVKVAIKLVVSAIVVLLVVKNRKFASIPRGLWGLIGGLTIINAAVAVLWQ